MSALHRYTFLAALALGVFPVAVPAGEAPAPSAATQREEERKLAEAQQKLDAAAKEVAELSRQMGRRFNFNINNEPGNGPPPQALLGVNVDRAFGRDGARVMDVSPGGAAAEAGIKPGDIITGIADLDLTKDGETARALVEKMNQLKPEQKVKVTVSRDGKKLTFDVAPRPAPQDVRAQQYLQRLAPQLGQVFTNESDARFRGAELASLSERLGSYFGVKSGVLVVRAGVDSQFKLQDGDVLMAIDGREITSAQQAGRILRSYQPGEKLSLKVQRDRKDQNLEITAPGNAPGAPPGGRNQN